VNSVKEKKWEYLKAIRYYFDITNSYVLNKLKIILLPFLGKVNWNRQVNQNTNDKEYLSGRNDLQAPDLYIPFISLFSLALIKSFLAGSFTKFSPELLGATVSTVFVFWILESILIRLCNFYYIGFHCCAIEKCNYLDVLSYTGYKNVNIAMTLFLIYYGNRWVNVGWMILMLASLFSFSVII